MLLLVVIVVEEGHVVVFGYLFCVVVFLCSGLRGLCFFACFLRVRPGVVSFLSKNVYLFLELSLWHTCRYLCFSFFFVAV